MKQTTKETICSNCTHRLVCSIAYKYERAVEAINSVTILDRDGAVERLANSSLFTV